MAINKKKQTITSADIGTLSTSLLNKQYVHLLPTQLLIRAHNRIELQHLQDPKNRRLQIAHTNLFLEMELREIEHFDTDPDFFTPSNIRWPFELEYNNEDRDLKYQKKMKNVDNDKIKKGKTREPKKPRFARTKKINREHAVGGFRGFRYLFFFKRKRNRRRIFAAGFISKKTERLKIDRANLIDRHSAAIDWASLLIGSDEVRKVFKDKAVFTWHLQPESGKMPKGNGPRPKKEHWYKTLFPPIGAYQAFMQKTLSAFYRKQTPPWAIQEWDIKLTVTNAGGSDTIEKKNYIQSKVDTELD